LGSAAPRSPALLAQPGPAAEVEEAAQRAEELLAMALEGVLRELLPDRNPEGRESTQGDNAGAATW
jgi:hypothetical protein